MHTAALGSALSCSRDEFTEFERIPTDVSSRPAQNLKSAVSAYSTIIPSAASARSARPPLAAEWLRTAECQTAGTAFGEHAGMRRDDRVFENAAAENQSVAGVLRALGLRVGGANSMMVHRRVTQAGRITADSDGAMTRT